MQQTDLLKALSPDGIFSLCLSFGAQDAGFARVDDGPAGFPRALSIVVRLSDAIMDEVVDKPTYTYFNHYRSVNALIDNILLRTGLMLQQAGFRYITVAASQSKPDSPFEGRYSHKKAAVCAGLGKIGRNSLFLHHRWGPRVRLGTLFTDYSPGKEPVEGEPVLSASQKNLHAGCEGCRKCIELCPSGALSDKGVDAAVCSAWMKKEYQHIGRGSVCGICISCCPAAFSPAYTPDGYR